MIEIDTSELLAAYQTARRDLLARRSEAGQWTGRLCSSALATATAVSALSLVGRSTSDPERGRACQQAAQAGLAYLRGAQNPDGGFGDTDRSFSNVATTMLVRAAIELARGTAEDEPLMRAADEYLAGQGGLEAVRRRYGDDQTFAAPILSNAALAGLVEWAEVPALPFELACLPHGWLPKVGLPVVSYAIPALVTIGQAKFFHSPPARRTLRILRRLAVRRSLRQVERMQPASGGFLEAVPLTSFVLMSLAATGRADHVVARRATGFLLGLMREDGSWPVDANLATWNTTQAIQSLAAATGEVGALRCLDWLVGCQHRRVHPFTRAAPGGWGWTDLPGAVPDSDDTSGALLVLRIMHASSSAENRTLIDRSAAKGLRWLLGLQNADGGWPTFCRGWGRLPFDRSAADLTAHALRALAAWAESGLVARRRVGGAIERGLRFLARTQRGDGSWVPLWFGNQYHPAEENPIYGTARVLLAYRDLGRLAAEPARRGLAWICASPNSDGGWGNGQRPYSRPCAEGHARQAAQQPGGQSSVEGWRPARSPRLMARSVPGCGGWSRRCSRGVIQSRPRSVSTLPACGIMMSCIRCVSW